EQTQALAALLTRRRQLVEMLAAEKNRLVTVQHRPALKRDVEEHIKWLEKRIDYLDDDLRKQLEESEVWRVNDQLLQSVPGVGDVTSRTLLSERTLARAPLICALPFRLPLSPACGATHDNPAISLSEE